MATAQDAFGLPDAAAHPPAVPATTLREAHATVCAAKSAKHPQTAGSQRHHQLGHRAGRADHVSHGSGPTPHRVLVSHPRRRSVVTCLIVTAVVGMLYVAIIETFRANVHPDLIWSGLLFIVFCGALIENVIRFDALTQQDSPDRSADAASSQGPVFPGGVMA